MVPLIADGLYWLSERFVEYDWFEGYPDQLTRGLAAVLLSSLLLYHREGTKITNTIIQTDRIKVEARLKEVTGARSVRLAVSLCRVAFFTPLASSTMSRASARWRRAKGRGAPLGL